MSDHIYKRAKAAAIHAGMSLGSAEAFARAKARQSEMDLTNTINDIVRDQSMDYSGIVSRGYASEDEESARLDRRERVRECNR
jgi:hypothetical protein